jgi:hypothetical protein
MKFKWFDCKCHNAEHAIRFVYDEEDNDLWLDVHLIKRYGFFGRCLVALQYICGYQCKYGAFDVWELKDEDVDDLIELLNEKKKLSNKNPA